jgi:hypothetical protein
VSTFWEDKKVVHSLLDDAYRQNRMAAAAAIRHLHSLHVKAPVFGVVWSDGSIRAHVDWCVSKEGEPPVRATTTLSFSGEKVITYPPWYHRSFNPHFIQARMATIAVGMGATLASGILVARPI